MNKPFDAVPCLRRTSALTNAQLSSIDRYLQTLLQQDSERLRKTHLFHHRYENIYLERQDNTELTLLLDESLGFCADMLAVGKDELAIGYWFNLMQPGEVTSLHSHNDMFELVSGVIYLTVPEHSGNLVIVHGQREIEVEPAVGQYVFFDPATPHRVNENRSRQHRLSIGMNIGLREHSIHTVNG